VTRRNGLAATGNDRDAATSVAKDAVASIGKVPAKSVGEVSEVARASSVAKDAAASVGKVPVESVGKIVTPSIAEVAVASVFEVVSNIDRPYVRKTRRKYNGSATVLDGTVLTGIATLELEVIE